MRKALSYQLSAISFLPLQLRRLPASKRPSLPASRLPSVPFRSLRRPAPHPTFRVWFAWPPGRGVSRKAGGKTNPSSGNIGMSNFPAGECIASTGIAHQKTGSGTGSMTEAVSWDAGTLGGWAARRLGGRRRFRGQRLGFHPDFVILFDIIMWVRTPALRSCFLASWLSSLQPSFLCAFASLRLCVQILPPDLRVRS